MVLLCLATDVPKCIANWREKYASLSTSSRYHMCETYTTNEYRFPFNIYTYIQDIHHCAYHIYTQYILFYL